MMQCYPVTILVCRRGILSCSYHHLVISFLLIVGTALLSTYYAPENPAAWRSVYCCGIKWVLAFLLHLTEEEAQPQGGEAAGPGLRSQ